MHKYGHSHNYPHLLKYRYNKNVPIFLLGTIACCLLSLESFNEKYAMGFLGQTGDSQLWEKMQCFICQKKVRRLLLD